MRTILKFISCFMAVFAVFELAVGLATADVAVMSIAVFLIWGAAMLHSLSRPKINFIYLFFLITFFVFLLSRVMVRWITEQEIYHPFTDQVMIHTYACLFISIVGLFVGSTLKVRFTFSSKRGTPSCNYYDPLNSHLNLDLLRQISGFLTTITGFATLVVNIEKIVYYGISGSGGELRISFASTLPSIILRLSYIYVLMLCIYLATMPKKREATLIFIQYLAISATKMLFGSRSDFILGLMFMAVYYLMRDHLNDRVVGIVEKEKWFGKKEVIVCIAVIPLIIILVVFVGYYRVQSDFEFAGVYETLLEFFESQGVSIDIIGYTYNNADKLQQPHFLYLFDNTWTFLKTNPISAALFGTKAYGVNTIERALYGTSLDQSLYYIINPTSYLMGRGCGSSYVAEAYLGYGYFGVFILNAVLAAVMEKMYEFKYRTFAGLVVSLAFIQQLFFMPRAGFDEFLSDFASATHLMTILILWGVYKLFNRRIQASKKESGFR